MRAALISLIETVPGGTALRGAVPLANGQLSMLHIDLAHRAGASEIMCLVASVGERVRQLEAYAMASGVAFHLVRSVADISVRLASEDELLIIADGLYVAPADMAALAAETGVFVATFIPGDGARALAERFERIDINHVWAGLACVRARDLIEARALPEDWSVPSALLRLAVQRGYRRLVLPFALAEGSRIAMVRDSDEADALAMQELAGRSGSLGARLARTAPVRALAQRAWRASWARPALRIAALAAPLAAAGLAIADWSMAALAILVAGRTAGHAANRLFGRFASGVTRPGEIAARDIAFAAAFLVITVLTVAASDRLAGLFTALILPGIALALASVEGRLPPVWARAAGSPSLIALAALIAVPFGALLPVLMLWSLILVGLLLAQTRSMVVAAMPRVPHN